MSEKKLIQVVGKGCKKCEKLYENVEKAIEDMGKREEYEVVHFTEVDKFVDLDIFMTPGLRVNGKVVSEGRIMSVEKIKKLL